MFHPVLIPRHDDTADLVVVDGLTFVVRQGAAPIQPLDDLRRDAALLAEPKRCPDDEDVGGFDFLKNLGPCIPVPFILGHAERDVVVDDADDLRVDPELIEVRDDILHQSFRMRGRVPAFQGTVQE